jgi:hypothetical protein
MRVRQHSLLIGQAGTRRSPNFSANGRIELVAAEGQFL